MNVNAGQDSNPGLSVTVAQTQTNVNWTMAGVYKNVKMSRDRFVALVTTVTARSLAIHHDALILMSAQKTKQQGKTKIKRPLTTDHPLDLKSIFISIQLPVGRAKMREFARQLCMPLQSRLSNV